MKARALALSLIAAAAAGAAAAQLRPPAESAQIEPLPSHALVTEAATWRPSLLLRAPADIGRSAWESATKSISLVEMPNYSLTPDRARPSYALGFASETMRNWMNDLGMDAGACTAPIIRLRTRIDAGEFRGTLWVHARCSLW